MSSSAPFESLDHPAGTPRPGRVRRRWSQFGARAFAQRAGRHHLRRGGHTLASQAKALTPLGLTAHKRATLAAASVRRPAALYQALFATP
jgi:hypothetical protein